MLLGPEETPRVVLGVFFLAAPGLGCLMLRVLLVCSVGVGCGGGGRGGGGRWVGVWLFVECCIVDASILLW